VGLQARLMSQALRKLSGAIRQSNAVMIFTNQIRMKIGVMFGNPETTTGGNALKFYASVRLDMRRIGSLKGAGDVVIGNRTRAKVVKNKVAPPFRMAEFDILFGKGIDRLGDLVDLSTNAGILEKSGAWLSWKETRLGQGRDKTREFLATQPDLVAGIEKETLLAVSGGDGLGLPTSISTSAAEGAEDGATTPAASAPVAAGAAPATSSTAPAAKGPAPESAARSLPVVTRKTLPAKPAVARK
jgi:recombination protein RecA